MDIKTFHSIIEIGETVAVEFKRCGNGMEADVYESVCSFLNRFGGDLFFGVLDDGTVVGVPEKAAADMARNFIKVISNPEMFSPTVYLAPEILDDGEGHTVIHVHVPPSAEVHSFKKVIYDRVDDADVKVTSTSAIAQMYIRKQDIFTERKIYKYVDMADFRLDLLPKVRQMAVNNVGGDHAWKNMGDEELLRSAGLFGTDKATGERGYNLAAIMLLGKDDVIRDVCPAYLTDALLRKVNVDRYDDRETIQTNLIESFDLLMDFARKHLLDKFFLEDEARVSLRNILAREMISNILMHREYTSSYMAKFVIENDRMYTENASRALGDGFITPENLEPNPKNPIIASFFRNIGLADTLGSGTTKLFKYSKYYSGKDPEFKEGDVFRIVVPLDDAYSFDYALDNPGIRNNSERSEDNTEHFEGDSEHFEGDSEHFEDNSEQSEVIRNKNNGVDVALEDRILALLRDFPDINQAQIGEKLSVSRSTIQREMKVMVEKGMVEHQGGRKTGRWVMLKVE